MSLDWSSEQEGALLELRSSMMHELPPNIYNDDVFLYKFLTARDFNVKKTEIMLRNHLRFRKEIQADTLLSFKSYEVLEKFVAQTQLGFDKDGCPLRYCPLGNIDGIGLTKSTNYLYLLKHFLRILETDKKIQKEQSEKLGKPVYQSVYIFDFDKFSFAQATNKQGLAWFIKGVGVMQDNYPEMLKRVFAINVSSIFTIPWLLVKPFLAPKLLEKIHISGQSNWKDDLLKHIDADVLPAFLGGNRTDPDGNPMCSTFIMRGGTVPRKYYLEKNIEKTAHKPGMKYIRLERQAQTSIPIYIQKSMSILKWEFELKCHDIGFGLAIESSSEGKAEEIIPVHKQETENRPMCGMHRCEKAGKYTIVFDNSYSWIYPKDIYFRTWVLDSNEME